jgi:Fe-S cluster assembly protein SufD
MSQVLLEKILSRGFPTPRDENWKYTNINAIALKPFQLAQRIARDEKHKCNILFINGYIVNTSLPDGIKIKPLSRLHEENLSGDIFENLNKHFFQDGLEIIISKSLKNPLEILYVSTEENWVQPRIQIIVEKNTEAKIIETFLSEAVSITNIVTQIEVKENAKLSYFKVQEENEKAFHIGRTNIVNLKNSQTKTFTISKGGKLARSDINIQLKEEGASSELYGLYISKNKMHLDHHTIVEHCVPHTKSHEHYRGILMDDSRAVFNGKVIVQKNAIQTEAEQSNHNLLLSSNAEIDTKPELEIYCDDVKCTHGATIGQLDDEALFYLRSRGLDEISAKQLLINAFANKILDFIDDKELRDKLCLHLN